MEKYLAIIGGLVFFVQLTVQLIKDMPLLKKVPTDMVTIVLSIMYSELVLAAWSQYASIVLAWYHYVGTLFGGLVVAYIAMYGWSKLKDLWERTLNKK